MIGGYLMSILDFQWVCMIAAIIQLAYAPLLLFLRVTESANLEDEQKVSANIYLVCLANFLYLCLVADQPRGDDANRPRR